MMALEEIEDGSMSRDVELAQPLFRVVVLHARRLSLARYGGGIVPILALRHALLPSYAASAVDAALIDAESRGLFRLRYLSNRCADHDDDGLWIEDRGLAYWIDLTTTEDDAPNASLAPRL
ncbi:hypothetical protein [Sorangium sp. So ce204]|uniref:hypothetical protein n=1 Tax=Sorangium sp. So ce204 TaxID=3133288 RepID=UPI003F5DA3CD